MYRVICKECGLEHSVDDVVFLNVEEDHYGRDVAYFECPVTKNPTSSLVYETGE